MLDKTKRYLVVGLGLLGGKYALELSKAGFHVDGINRSEGHLQFALDHGYIERGKTHDFEDLVREADHIIFGLYPTALIEWFRTYGPLLKPGCIFTDVSGVKTGLVEPVQALCPAGIEFIASHPMAGRETSSVEHAAEVNFAPANFIITPTGKNTPEAIAWVRELAEVLGFKQRNSSAHILSLMRAMRVRSRKESPVYSHSEVLSLAHIRLTAMAWHSWLT